MKNFFRKNIFLVAPLVIVLFLTSHVGAVEVNTFDTEFSVNIVPSNPSPGTPVTAEIISYQFDVDRSVITWTIGGEKITSGIGEKKINFVTPNFGANKPMTVDIITSKGIETSKTINFSGDDIDILWEAGTITPVWYKGKALPVKKSYVRFYAVPHVFSGGKEVDPSSLIYEWKVNYKKIPNASGFNKRSISVRLNDFGEYVVGVKVSDKNKQVAYEKNIKVSAQGIIPMVMLHEEDPLKGTMFGLALEKTFNLISDNLIIKAEPYNFMANKQDLNFKWRMNNQEVKGEISPEIISLKAPSGSGFANLSVKTSYQSGNISQEVSKTLKINF